jgi:adenine-specific DNA-methyltransferase
MEIRILKPRKALNKAFLKVKPNRTEIESFKTNLSQLLDRINDNESEEFHKNLVSDFLKDTYYKQNHFINTKGRNDLVIHNTNSASGAVGVIIEAKKPTNKSEMVSKDKVNGKAFQELVLYYLRERIAQKNIEIKYLIATNINEWFIFDATLFDRLFAQNKNLVKQFNDFECGRLADTKTDFFYKQVAEPFIAEIKNDIEFTYFDIRDYEKPLRNADKKDDNQLIALFKLLSPEHLLKLPFANDSNSLDKRFYGELLHIIGLIETKDGSKKLIERNKDGERNTGSILENAIIQLDSLDKTSRLENPSQFGSNLQERLFNVGLELSITWINRILFLKLLEAQLITYHKGDKSYEFLSFDKIKDYDDLNSLFFQVLARRQNERNEDIKALFAKVPYLNSSLFEPTEIEHTTLFISQLRNDKTIPIYSQTVLKDTTGKKRTGNINPLEYLFEFLNDYDFASEGSEEIQEDNKTLINASVLGLIFEKINGYKDGSFFTPGFITMYMCRETIRKAVVHKFNETKKWNCTDIDTLYDKIEDRKEANKIINDLKICDPAVGSGHFLVSALNEMIAIKSDLKILQDRDGKRLKEYHFEVVNDELIVTDEDGELFEYIPTNKESQRIQETLFHEKQTIIENCLFGVDLNPNSVKICRLRLWIELLKNAYYKNETELETLPNIDINIKCGNSLISRFALDADLKQALKKSASKWTIDSYRLAVDTYRNAQSKEQKREMVRLINEIKTNFRSEISLNDPKAKRLRALNGELFTMTNQGQLFELSKKEKAEWNAKVAKLTAETLKLETEIEEIKSNKIYENAFEWRFEFPEVLDDNGDFVGFDIIIGNPPYISNWDLSVSNRNIVIYLEEVFKPYLNGHWDLFGCFVMLGSSILKEFGYNSYILPTSFYKEKHSTELRRYFLNQIRILELIDFKELVVFEDVARQTGIYLVQKAKPNSNTFIVKNSVDEKGSIVFQDFFKDLKNFAFKTNVNNQDIVLFKKLNANAVLLGNIVCINTGVVAHSKIGSPIKFTKDDVITKQPQDGFKKYVIGSNLSSHTIIFDGTFMDYDSKKDFFHRPKFPLLFESEKVIVRRISGKNNSIIACFDDEKYYSNDNLMHLVLWNQQILEFQKPEKKWDAIIDSKYSLKLIAAILNSKLITYFFSKFLSTDTLQGSYSSIYPEDLRQIPIKYDDNFVSLIESVSVKINEIKKQKPSTDTSDLENQIDQLVYQLYDLTAEEIEIIEGSVR